MSQKRCCQQCSLTDRGRGLGRMGQFVPSPRPTMRRNSSRCAVRGICRLQGALLWWGQKRHGTCRPPRRAGFFGFSSAECDIFAINALGSSGTVTQATAGLGARCARVRAMGDEEEFCSEDVTGKFKGVQRLAWMASFGPTNKPLFVLPAYVRYRFSFCS